MSEVMVPKDKVLSAVRELVRRGGCSYEKPLRELERRLADPRVTDMGVKDVVRFLVEAGCSLDTIRVFLMSAGIISSDREWSEKQRLIARAAYEVMAERGEEEEF